MAAVDGYFVPLVGQESDTSFSFVRFSDDHIVRKLIEQPEFSEPFWWGSQTAGDFIQCTAAFRAFLSITEPNIRAIDLGNGRGGPQRNNFAFGFVDDEQNSCVIAKKGKIIGSGPTHNALRERFKKAVCAWIDLGMPPGSAFSLTVYSAHSVPPSADENVWIDRRGCSMFV